MNLGLPSTTNVLTDIDSIDSTPAAELNVYHIKMPFKMLFRMYSKTYVQRFIYGINISWKVVSITIN